MVESNKTRRQDLAVLDNGLNRDAVQIRYSTVKIHENCDVFILSPWRQ